MNHPSPIPCAHCGTNFMRVSLDPETPKLCNNCSIKDSQKLIPKESKMLKVQLLIECDRDTQIEIEELCINRGLSISQYLIGLHKSARGETALEATSNAQKEMGWDENAQQDEDHIMVRQRKSRGVKK